MVVQLGSLFRVTAHAGTVLPLADRLRLLFRAGKDVDSSLVALPRVHPLHDAVHKDRVVSRD